MIKKAICRADYACWPREEWCWKDSFLILFGHELVHLGFVVIQTLPCSQNYRLPNYNTLWHFYSYKDMGKRKESMADNYPNNKQRKFENKTIALVRAINVAKSPFVDKWSKFMPYGVSWFLLKDFVNVSFFFFFDKEFVNDWYGDKMIIAVVVWYWLRKINALFFFLSLRSKLKLF